MVETPGDGVEGTPRGPLGRRQFPTRLALQFAARTDERRLAVQKVEFLAVDDPGEIGLHVGRLGEFDLRREHVMFVEISDHAGIEDLCEIADHVGFVERNARQMLRLIGQIRHQRLPHAQLFLHRLHDGIGEEAIMAMLDHAGDRRLRQGDGQGVAADDAGRRVAGLQTRTGLVRQIHEQVALDGIAAQIETLGRLGQTPDDVTVLQRPRRLHGHVTGGDDIGKQLHGIDVLDRLVAVRHGVEEIGSTIGVLTNQETQIGVVGQTFDDRKVANGDGPVDTRRDGHLGRSQVVRNRLAQTVPRRCTRIGHRFHCCCHVLILRWCE